MATSREEEIQQLEGTKGIPRTALRATFHLRRYMPLYAFATIWVLMIALVPTIDRQKSGGANVATAGGGAAATDDASAGTAAGGVTGDTSTGGGTTSSGGSSVAAGGGTTGGGGGGSASPGSKPIAAVQTGQGITKTGVACKPGVRQIPYSVYAAPCVAKYDGGNGGGTANGVSDTAIKIAIRAPADANGPNAQAVNKVQAQAGQLTSDQQVAAFKALLPWFNKQYELYGRHVEFVDYSGTGNGTDEAQSKGGDAACVDANDLANTKHVFGVIRFGTYGYESQPFADCAKKYGLYLPLGAPYFPESWYQNKWDPYVWGGTMDCEKISHGVAEYIGKRLAKDPAKYAGDALLKQAAHRKFGTYVPNNDGYGHCVDISHDEAIQKWGVSKEAMDDRYNYVLDVSQFPSEANRGILQFNSNHDTTIVLACDPISITFLTQSAAQQNYHPEWFIIGVALEDTDGYGRLYDPRAVTGRLFGMSQLGSDAKVNDPNGEAAKAFKEATGKDMPTGTGVIYYNLVLLFNQLQAAGPALNINAIAKATHALPPGGSDTAPLGVLQYGNWHTAISDSREVYWDDKKPGFDGKAGTFVETLGGKRFQNGTWPDGPPPIYPGQ